MSALRAADTPDRVLVCVPTTVAEQGEAFFDPGSSPRIENDLCTANPAKEPMISMDLLGYSTQLNDVYKVSMSVTSTKYSAAFGDRFVAFPQTPAFIDRSTIIFPLIFLACSSLPTSPLLARLPNPLTPNLAPVHQAN